MNRSAWLAALSITILVGAISTRAVGSLAQRKIADRSLTPKEASEIAIARTGAVQAVVLEWRSNSVYIVVVEHENGAREGVKINGGSPTTADDTRGGGFEVSYSG